MYLKRMTMFGFKSFGAETVIEFPKGITALVGPNGGGKSNVVDALRWALGEQRPRELRAERWPDILFAGESGISPARLAEVVLTFDQANLQDPEWPETITVTRRYYRNGESEYLLNGRSVRLKDVTDLFLDSGLGRSNYAIISQGGVESALLLKPKERLEQLEESSGVSRYKLRRRETLQHLAEVEVKLTRLGDLIAEVSSEADGVREKAELEERLDGLNARAKVLAAQIRRTRFAIDEAERKRLGVACEVEEKARREAHSQIETLDHAERELVAEDTLIRGQLMAKREELEKIGRLLGQAETGLVKAETLSAGYARELASVEDRRAQLSEWIMQSMPTAGSELDAAGADATLPSLDAIQAEREALRTRWLEGRSKRDRVAQEMAQLDQQWIQIGQKRGRLEAFLGLEGAIDLSESWAQRVAEHTRQREEIADLRRELDRLTELRSQAVSRGSRVHRQLSELEQRWASASAEWRAVSSRNSQASGLSAGVRAILSGAERGVLPAPRGTLRSLIEADAKFEDALTVALGGSHQDLVIDYEADARQWVQWLKVEQRGRATFLPLDILTSGEVAARDLILAEMPGAVGWASDLVRFEPVIRPAVRHALGRVLVVEGLDDATRIGRSHRFRFRTVTLDGQVLLVGGAITGGQRPMASSPRPDLQRLQGALDRLKREKEACEQEAEEIEREGRALATKIESATGSLAERHAVWQHDEQLLQGLSKEEDPGSLAAREIGLVEQRGALAKWLADQDQSNLEMESLFRAKEQEIAAIGALQAEQQGAEELRHALQVRDEAERGRWHAELDDIEARRHTLALADQEQRAEAERWHRESEKLREAKTGAGRECEELAGRQEGVRKETADLADRRRGWEQRIVEADARLVDWRRKLDVIALRWEAAPLEAFEESLELMTTQELTRGEKELRQLGSEIAQIGSVERGSLGRWRDLNARREQLSLEEADVYAAKTEMEATLGQLDDLVALRVRETADRVESAFQQACATLFGGGSATFRWTTDEEPGVDLWVAPPGKRPARLSLLSGGEKALGGLAWLFSLLSIRQAPFVVLDEVEASLDELNAARFGHYLAERGAQSQFIVITHHKATMEAASALWGISGNGRGQSRVVSVRLEPAKAVTQ